MKMKVNSTSLLPNFTPTNPIIRLSDKHRVYEPSILTLPTQIQTKINYITVHFTYLPWCQPQWSSFCFVHLASDFFPPTTVASSSSAVVNSSLYRPPVAHSFSLSLFHTLLSLSLLPLRVPLSFSYSIYNALFGFSLFSIFIFFGSQ